MSDIPILPSDTGELMVCAPSQAFFQSEQGVDATSTLGRYDYPTDFNLVQAPGSTSWAYQSVETGKPLHVFLLGEVHSMGATQGEAVQVSDSSETPHPTNF
jgi:hypothetical protein